MYDMSDLKSKKLLTRSEAAFYMGVTTRTIDKLTSKTNFTPLTRIGFGRGKVFINREKLDQWIDEQDGSRKPVK